jgi:hypothetical protein
MDGGISGAMDEAFGRAEAAARAARSMASLETIDPRMILEAFNISLPGKFNEL